MKRRVLALLAAFLCVPAFADRLPRFVLPQHYDLTVTPDLANERFAGDETIVVNVQRPVTTITLHAAEIRFSEVTIQPAGGAPQTATVKTDEKEETATFTVAEPLPVGPAAIHIKYDGILNRQLRGFYIGQANGKKYLASQMESVDARRAFPSFDEPDMKATFRINVIADEKLNVISNSAVESETPGPVAGKRTVRFAATPRLSTYHIALVVGDFACIGDSVDGLPIRICAPPEKVEMTRFALQATKDIVSFYNRYYEIPYPFQKLDQIALADFAAGAMENPGAITYRERILLTGPSIDSRRGAVGTIAHEVAHMWFGDLVTMRWWDDIWLNEGFASWMGGKAVKAVHPEWVPATSEASGAGFPMNSDALLSTRPIHKNADTPEEIAQLFDGIAYGKTAAILRMLETYVGEEKFRDGINLYIRRNAFSNASASDFAAALDEATGQHVTEILSSYVNQAGVPLVTVRNARCENGRTIAELEQQRFLIRGERTPEIRGQLWTIPVCFEGSDCILLRERTQTASVPGCKTPLFVNAAGRGYYVTAYDDASYEQLSADRAALSPSDRVALLRDEGFQVRTGQRRIGDYFDLATSFGDDPTAVRSALSVIAYAYRYLAEPAQRPLLEKWVRNYAAPLAAQLGWSTRAADTTEDRELRSTVIASLAEYGKDPATLKRARELGAQWLKNRKAIDPEMVFDVTRSAAIGGDAKLYDAYLSAFRSSTDPNEKGRFLTLLGAFRDPALLRRTLDLVLTDEVRSQDMAGVLSSVIGNPAGGDLGWRFVKENWDAIAKKLPPGHAGRIISAASTLSCDSAAAAELKQFVAEHQIKEARQATAQAIDRIAACADVRRMQQPNLTQWLANR